MDNLLAELYGTNEPAEQDFEKVAHLDFLEKVAEDEGIDLNDLSDEDLEELAEVAAEALEDDDYEYEDDDDLEKEAAAKVEEADFLGRVMAHSFNQEMDEIDMEKYAGARLEKYVPTFARGGRAVRNVGREVAGRGRRAWRGSSARKLTQSSSLGGRMKSRFRAADKGVRGLGRRLGAKSQLQGARAGARAGYRTRVGTTRRERLRDIFSAGHERRAIAGAKSGRKRALLSQRLRGYGALGGGAAAVGAAGAGGAAYAGRDKQSADEAWDEAIHTRAWEHLMQAGLADQEGNFVPAEELGKTASDEQIDYEVDAAALELLQAEGYPVEWY